MHVQKHKMYTGINLVIRFYHVSCSNVSRLSFMDSPTGDLPGLGLGVWWGVNPHVVTTQHTYSVSNKPLLHFKLTIQMHLCLPRRSTPGHNMCDGWVFVVVVVVVVLIIGISSF